MERTSSFWSWIREEAGTLFDDWTGRTSAAQTQEMTIEHDMTPRDLKLVPPNNLTEEQLAAWDAAYGPRNAAAEAAGLEGDELVRWKYQRYIKDYLRSIDSVDDNLGRQGLSLLPLMRGESPSDWRRAIYYQYFEYPGWHMVRRHW